MKQAFSARITWISLALIGMLLAMPARAFVVMAGQDSIAVIEGDSFVIDLATMGDGFPGVEGMDISFGGAGGFSLVSAAIPADSPIPVHASLTAGVSLGVALTAAPFFFDIPADGPTPLLGLTFSSLGVAPGTYTIFLSTLFNEDLTGYASSVRVSVIAVPEPSTWLLMAAGLAVAGAARRTPRRPRPGIRC